MDQFVIARQVERRRKRRRGIVALLAAVSMLTIGAGSMSLAQFIDSDSSTWAFATGTIDINSNPAVLSAVNGMMPGQKATDGLTISNDGSGALRYAIAAGATNALGGALNLEIRREDLNGACDDFDGAVVLAQTGLNGATVGNPAQGAHSGDRFLAAGTNEVLCFRVSLPLSAADTLQGASSTVTFTFDAEQTANNP